MRDIGQAIRADRGETARAIHVVDRTSWEDWLRGRPERERVHLDALGFEAKGYANAILPGDTPNAWSVVTVVANSADLSPWCLAKLPSCLPEGTYRLFSGEPGVARLGWLLGQYQFDRFKSGSTSGLRTLLTGDVAGIQDVVADARATMLVRDLVNMPAEQLGPAGLADAAKSVADAASAKFAVWSGDRLRQEAPLIHAVGRAAARERAPRLIRLGWGAATARRVAIVGKGVTFDTGGLNLKPGAGMALMKKDMGGAAHALALAQRVMAARLPVRLDVLIPIAENAVGSDAVRPGDVLTARDGTTIEINNTDAEGRLLLADAITLAIEDKPELLIDFATLTGAARVALGPDLPALFGNDDALVEAAKFSGETVSDPLWPMPLWDGYDDMLKSDIADCVNAASGSFAGAVTAALFLRRFVPDDVAWLHLDTFAWRPEAKPGRPKGGDALGLRAVWHFLRARYGKGGPLGTGPTPS